MTKQPASAPRFEADCCANCFEPLPTDAAHRPWLFCSSLCNDYAHLIRYWRRVSRDGRLEADPTVDYAIKIQIAFLLAGGYDRKTRTIPPETRALVIERDRVCVRCGRPGAEIDHIDGSSNDPGNLQLLCVDCHHAKTDANLVPASPDQSALIAAIYLERVVPDQPALLCDSDDWATVERTLRAERRARLVGPPKRSRRNSLDPSTITWLET